MTDKILGGALDYLKDATKNAEAHTTGKFNEFLDKTSNSISEMTESVKSVPIMIEKESNKFHRKIDEEINNFYKKQTKK